MQPVEAMPAVMGSRAMRKEIVKLAWPVIAEQVLTTLANMVDAILVGRLGAVAVAAIGLSQQPHWLMTGLFMGLGIGVNALVARFQGAGETNKIEAATRAGFWVGLMLSTVAGVLIFVGAPAIMRFTGAEPEVLPLGAEFLRFLAPGMVVVFWSMVMSAALRATGDTRTPMVLNLGVNVMNALLAFGLIYGHFGLPAMGLAGAGLATTLSRFAGGATLMMVLLRRDDGARLRLRTLIQIEWDLLWRILKVGYVSSSERIMSTVIYIGFARMVATLGTFAVAAHTLTIVAENLSWFLSSGFAMATAVMVGQRLGAGRPEEADAAVREAVRMASVLLGVLGLLFILVPGPYVALFTDDPTVRQLSANVLRIAGVTEVATAIALTVNGALSGAGDTRPLFLVNIGGGAVRLSLTALFLFVMGWGLPGAWIAASVDWVVRASLTWMRFRSGHWRTVKV